MVKELQKKFIKTTMLVVTILLVVFLASITILNYSLSRRDSEDSLEKIAGINLRELPGSMGEDNMNMEGPGDEGRVGPEGQSGTMMPMSEADGERGGPDGINEDLGRYVIARVNKNGAIVFKDMTHDVGMTFSDLVDLINKANVSFGVEATGETETEGEFTEPANAIGDNPPEEGTIPGDGEGAMAGAGGGPGGVNEGMTEGEAPPALPGENPGSAPGSPSGEKPDSAPGEDPGSASDSASGEKPDSASGEAPGSAPGSAPGDNSGAAPADEGSTTPKVERGRVDGYRFYAQQQADGSVAYVFLNVSEQIESVLRIFFVTLGVGLALWILILFVVTFLSKKAIAPIAESIEKQRQFITDAGHEIKTPLAVIVSNVDVQELHGGKTKWLDNIRAQALRLSELTKQMLTLSKMEESGTASFVATTFDASSELEDMVRIFREGASLRDIDIRTEIEPGAQIHFPKEQYQQMIELLLDNAMKYGKEHGFLEVALRNERRTVTLTFKNDCEKLPDIDPDRLFERFYRSDSSRSRQTGGSGIGLAVVRAIAEHGGGYAKAHFLPDEVIEFEIQLQKKI